ncbi:MAG: tRNA lysidine(34) synthetase TilS [Rhodoferax sp.]|nr:tRNA lysidine(34) synthetase TilS [Rhodoferax sp.]
MTLPLDVAIAEFEPELPLAVAYSGGADSTALLVACQTKWPGQVVAWHVNHGLQAAAADFEQHCQARCSQLSVPLEIQRVDARHLKGQSPEDAARRARYEAFDALVRRRDGKFSPRSVALAQHADDQAETLLLALIRGAGVAGLSAMPAIWLRGNLTYHRPLLQVSAADIRCWLAQQQLDFVEDPSNTNQSLTRNRIRAHLIPVLAQTFPQFLDTFGRSASHAAQAQQLLDEVAAHDAILLDSPDAGALPIKPLRELSAPRQANVLRHWLKLSYGVVPSTAQLAELQHQLSACKTRGHAIHIKVGQGYVRRVGAALHWYNP